MDLISIRAGLGSKSYSDKQKGYAILQKAKACVHMMNAKLNSYY